MRVVHDMDGGSVMNSLYSLGKVMTWESNHLAFARNVVSVVRSNFEFIEGELPPVRDADSFEVKLVQYCLQIDLLSSPPASESIVARKSRAAAVFLNGDWRQSRIQHYCRGCCTNRAASEDKAIVKVLDLLDHEMPPIPALSRWGKQQPAAAYWYLGIRCHNIFKEAFVPMFEGLEERPPILHIGFLPWPFAVLGIRPISAAVHAAAPAAPAADAFCCCISASPHSPTLLLIVLHLLAILVLLLIPLLLCLEPPPAPSPVIALSASPPLTPLRDFLNLEEQ
eukprot:7036013-Pyramimonas_sp.AAC.1